MELHLLATGVMDGVQCGVESRRLIPLVSLSGRNLRRSAENWGRRRGTKNGEERGREGLSYNSVIA
jgi:hypothetical protein